MKRTIKYMLICVGVIILALSSFIAGAYYRPVIWIDPPAYRSQSTMIFVCPPPNGPLYSTDDFSRANRAVDDFLRLKASDPKYKHLDLGYFVTPEDRGYITHTYSALKFKSAGRPFPEDLKAGIDEVFERALNQPEAEQAGAGQPATRPESKSEGSDKPQPESEGRSR